MPSNNAVTGYMSPSGSHFSTRTLRQWLEQDSFRDVVIRLANDAFLRNFTRLGLLPMMDFTFLCTANKYN